MKILPLCILFVVVVTILPQTVFGAGSISEGFAIGEALPEWIGWAIVVGLGMVFAIIITIEVKIEEKYLGVNQTSEMLTLLDELSKQVLLQLPLFQHGLGLQHYCNLRQ